MKRQLAEQRGRTAEAQVATWLRAQGWRVLETRVRTPAGEIDLVARRGSLVAFVEVKWRALAYELDYAIDQHRLARVAAAAEAVAHRYLTDGDDMRIDVILLAPDKTLRHIENAWQP